MKKLKFWLFAALAVIATVTFTACSDDDKNEPDVPTEPVDETSPLIGQWMYYEEYGSTLADMEMETIWLTFNQNGRFICKYEYSDSDGLTQGTDEGTYTINGSKVTMKCTKMIGAKECLFEKEGETLTFTWSVSGKTLTFDGQPFSKL